MRLAHLNFEAPGPGLWFTDGLHSFKPRTEISQQANNTVGTGMQISNWTYGTLAGGMLAVAVHRFGYAQMRNLLSKLPGPEDVAKARFEAELRANPHIQERLARAEVAIATKRWRADVEHWDKVTRPWLLGRTLELTDLKPAEMSDQGLIDHVAESIYQHQQASMHHHMLNMVNFAPRGYFMVKTMDWAGATADELEPLMIGSSPISAGDEPELRALADAIRADETATAIVAEDDDAAGRLDRLVSHPGKVGPAAAAFIRMVGHRTLFGWEVMNPYVLERPQLLLGKIRHALEDRYAQLDENSLAAVRDKVPDVHRNEFDELLGDARKYHRIRDERDIYCNMPTGGILRRAVIEVGGRLVDKGVLSDREHATEASLEELRALLMNGGGPTDTDLGERYHFRQEYSIEDVPASLGTPDQEPVPYRWLPDIAQLFARMQMIQFDSLQSVEPRGAVLHGKAASPGVCEGTARVILGIDELDRIQPGDILITSATNPTFNIVLPRVGGIVTQYGGLLSHAAIVAREFGLPSVVGCKELLKTIKDGDRVRVDGDNGTVTLV